jgi:Kelch motif
MRPVYVRDLAAITLTLLLWPIGLVYDPATNTWSAAGSLNTARTNPAAATGPCETNTTKTCIYAIGGQALSASGLTSVEMYDPSSASNSWTSVQPMHTPRLLLGAASAPCVTNTARTCLYAAGGTDSVATFTRLASTEMYDPQANTWTAVASLNTGRSDLGAAAGPCVSAPTSTCVYAIGGVSRNGFESSTEMFLSPGGPTAVPVRGFRVRTDHGWMIFSWTVIGHPGLAGFNVYAAGHRLNPKLIPTHRSPKYRYRVHSKRHKPGKLEVVLLDGRTVIISGGAKA